VNTYEQSDFSGGINTEFDPTKIPRNSYPLGTDIRVRKNIVEPQLSHRLLNLPVGTIQKVFSEGSRLFVLVNGVAYTADTAAETINFQRVPQWVAMDTGVDYYYSQLFPVTTNFLRTNATNVLDFTLTFDGSIAAYPAIYVIQDGLNTPQGITPDGVAVLLGSYDSWESITRLYVPIGKQMCVSGGKAYIVSPDGRAVYQSVSGRTTDFVVNVDSSGEKGGDATTVQLAFSGNATTAIKSTSDGSFIGTTLFGTFVETADYTSLRFAEPYFRAAPLFPAGAVNDRSFADLRGDTAFISQSGIHSFNFSQEFKIESNNTPLSGPLRGLLIDEQVNTCATNYKDYALFGVDTIYGRGVVVYDTTRSIFMSLDMSFGDVREFAVTKSQGRQRLFFYTAGNELYEAFAGEAYTPASIYLGDWCTQVAGNLSQLTVVNVVVGNILGSGKLYATLYVDGTAVQEVVVDVTVGVATDAGAVPDTTSQDTLPLPIRFDCAKGWKVGVKLSWVGNFSITHISAAIDDGLENDCDTGRIKVVESDEVSYGVLAGTYLNSALGTTSAAPTVIAGETYFFYPLTLAAKLQQGDTLFEKPAFITSTGNDFNVTSPSNARLWNVTTKKKLIDLFRDCDFQLHAGDYNSGQSQAMFLAARAQTGPVHAAVAGPFDYLLPQWFARGIGSPRATWKTIGRAAIWLYDHGLDFPASTQNLDGTVVGPSNAPNGWLEDSTQAKQLRTFRRQNNSKFRITLCSLPPYDTTLKGGGYVQLRHVGFGAQLVISGSAGIYSLNQISGVWYLNIPFSLDTPVFAKITLNDAYGRVRIYNAEGRIIAGCTIPAKT
jgi:hypothetical protein